MTFLHYRRQHESNLNCHENDSHDQSLCQKMTSEADFPRFKTGSEHEIEYIGGMKNKNDSSSSVSSYNSEGKLLGNQEIIESAEKNENENKYEILKKMPDVRNWRGPFFRKKDNSHNNRKRVSAGGTKSSRSMGSPSWLETTNSEIHNFAKQSAGSGDRTKHLPNMKDPYNPKKHMMLEQSHPWNWCSDRCDVDDSMDQMLLPTIMNPSHYQQRLPPGPASRSNGVLRKDRSTSSQISPSACTTDEKVVPSLNTLHMEIMENCIQSVKSNLMIPGSTMPTSLHANDRGSSHNTTNPASDKISSGIKKSSKVIIQCSMETIRPCGAQHLIYSNKPNTVRWFSFHLSNMHPKKASNMLAPFSVAYSAENQLNLSHHRQPTHQFSKNQQSENQNIHLLNSHGPIRNQHQLDEWISTSTLPLDIDWNPNSMRHPEDLKKNCNKNALYLPQKGGMPYRMNDDANFGMMGGHPNDVYSYNLPQNQNQMIAFNTSTTQIQENYSQDYCYSKFPPQHFQLEMDKLRPSHASNINYANHFENMLDSHSSNRWINPDVPEDIISNVNRKH